MAKILYDDWHNEVGCYNSCIPHEIKYSWPIKGRLDNVIKYAMNPEKTTADLSDLHAIDGVVEYAANELKTEKRMFVTCIGCTSEETAAQYANVNKKLTPVSNKKITPLVAVLQPGFRFFEPVRITDHVNHISLVSQAIHHRSGEDRIAENILPAIEWDICSNTPTLV